MEYKLLSIENNKIILSEQVIKDLCKFQRMKLKMEMMEKELKTELENAMVKNDISKYISPDGSVVVTYIAPTVRKDIDKKLLKEEMPEIYQKYVKETSVSGCVKITVK